MLAPDYRVCNRFVQRYKYFARQADTEGLTEVANLFRAVEQGEMSHAMGTLQHMNDLGDPATEAPMGDSVSNVRSALISEEFEAQEMYAAMATTAREEGLDNLAEWFDTLQHAQQNHHSRFSAALRELHDRGRGRD